MTRITATQGRLLVLAAACMWSMAGLGQRELSASPATQVVGRAVFAAVTVVVFVAILERGSMLEAVRRVGRWGIVLAVLLALAASMFMLALNYASVANVLFMQAASPMVAAALGWLIVGDVVTRRTLIAMLIAVVGVAVMVADSLGGGAAATVLPVLMTASFAGVLVIARHRSDVSMLPATALSQVLIVVAFAPFASFDSATGRDVGILAALGIAQTGIPLAFLTLAARVIPAAEVAILTLLEVVLGPLWVWLAYAERPATATLIGGGIVLVAVVTQALTQDPRARDRPAVT